MKYVKILFAIALVFVVCSASSLKKETSKPVYAFGVAASFTDTVVYFTNIQVLDSVKLKNGFLPHRDMYSYQLRNYMDDNFLLQNSTCMIYFSENRRKLEKEAVKMMNKYMKNKGITILQIEPEKFHFIKPED